MVVKRREIISRIQPGRERGWAIQEETLEGMSSKAVQRIMFRPTLLDYLESDCSDPTE